MCEWPAVMRTLPSAMSGALGITGLQVEVSRELVLGDIALVDLASLRERQRCDVRDVLTRRTPASRMEAGVP